MDLQSNTVPTIRLPSEENTEGELDQEVLREAVAKIQECSALLLHNVFPVEFVDSLHAASYRATTYISTI